MRWRGRRQSSNVEDRRGPGGGLSFPGGFGRTRGGPVIRRAGGGGIGFIIVIVIIAFIFGINPLELLSGGPISVDPGSRQTETSTSTQASGEMRDFVATVLAETEDTWSKIFAESGQQYREPTLVLFSKSVNSACGFASAATGPFYCPNDEKVYIDLSFYDLLRRRFDAPGDFAEAYVLAHEVGHHVQNLTGVLPKFNEARQRMSPNDANALSIKVELQADCYAGVWANRTENKGLLEAGDIEEALNAATQIGDDMIQRRTQGYVVPESFNHGTAEQRRNWFDKGFTTGSVDTCDTFNAPRV